MSELLADGTGRAGSLTSTTIDTCISIDLELTISHGDSTYRTITCASTTAYTSVVNYMCHDIISFHNVKISHAGKDNSLHLTSYAFHILI